MTISALLSPSAETTPLLVLRVTMMMETGLVQPIFSRSMEGFGPNRRNSPPKMGRQEISLVVPSPSTATGQSSVLIMMIYGQVQPISTSATEKIGKNMVNSIPTMGKQMTVSVFLSTSAGTPPLPEYPKTTIKELTPARCLSTYALRTNG